MSYEIAQKIRVTDGKLAFYWDSNNVYPRRYHWSEDFTPQEIASAITGLGIHITARTKLALAIRDLQEKYHWRKVYEKHGGFTPEFDAECKVNDQAFTKELVQLIGEPSKEKGAPTMEMQPIDTVTSEDQARQLAIDWHIWVGETEDLSYGELVEWQNYFEKLAKKFDLTEEFQENAII